MAGVQIVRVVAASPAAASEHSLLPERLETGLALSQLPALDGLRAVAAFMVVFYHFGFHGVSGGLGVLMFFVLSGFLITWLLLKEDEKTGSVSLRDFYIRRSLRIFPAFYCYWILVIGALLFFDKRIVWNQAIAALFYVNNYYQAVHGDPNTALSHTWSLGIEEQFYLLWPVTFLALRKNRARLARILAVVVLTIFVYREVLHFVVRVNQGYIYEAFDARADHLLIGCLLAIVLRAGMFPRIWSPLCRDPRMALIPAGLLLASTTAEYRFGTAYRNVVGFLVDPVLVALLLPQLIAFRESRLWSWLNWAWVRYLGQISYSVYLYQQIMLDPAKRYLASWPLFARLAIAIATVVIAASLSYFVVERPFLKLKDRFKHTAVAAR